LYVYFGEAIFLGERTSNFKIKMLNRWNKRGGIAENRLLMNAYVRGRCGRNPLRKNKMGERSVKEGFLLPADHDERIE
jgi:hypothetical protein